MDLERKKSARQWALKALGRRMHTVHEIKVALSKRGFGNEIAGSVVEDLCKSGLINDLDFARTWVLSRSVHQMHGRLRLLKDLKLKGVPDEIARQALEESLPDEDEVAIAAKAAEKKLRIMRANGKATGVKGRDSLYRHLRSKGFTTRTISLAMTGFTFEEDPS